LVVPPLRRALVHLLSQLHSSGDPRTREESAKLVARLIESSQSLLKPHVQTILKSVLPRLRDPDGDVSSAALCCVGRLALIGGEVEAGFVDQVVPIIIGVLQDKASVVKRETALRTLCQLVHSSGWVVEAYARYPQLLPCLLHLLKTTQGWPARRELVRLMGKIGALDPYKYKLIEGHNTSRQPVLRTETTPPPSHNTNDIVNPGKDSDKGSSSSSSSIAPPSAEEQYPTLAMCALLAILRDHALFQHHNTVIQAIIFIFKSLGVKCVPFLPQVLPPFLSTMSASEEMRDLLFSQLSLLIAIVKENIRDYVPQILALVHEHWREVNEPLPSSTSNQPLSAVTNTTTTTTSQVAGSSALSVSGATTALPQPGSGVMSESVLLLLDHLVMALGEDFKLYLPELMPQLLSTLWNDRTDKRLHSLRVLHSLEGEFLFLFL